MVIERSCGSRLRNGERDGKYSRSGGVLMSTSLQTGLLAMLAAAVQVPTPAAPTASAAQPTVPPPTALSPPPAGFVRIPANTIVDFEIVDPLSSKTSVADQMFAIRLVDPVAIDGATLLPAGTMGQGQIVHAAKARALGKAGELILAARYFSCGEARIALRGFHLGHSGKNKATELNAAIAVIGAVAAPLMFVSGGESLVPAGTRATARLKDAVDVRVAPGAPCAALPVSAAAPPAAVPPATVPDAK